MTWYQMVLLLFTNGLRVFLGLYFVVTLLHVTGNRRKASFYLVCTTVFVTILSCFFIRQFYLIGVEIVMLVLIVHYLFHAEARMCLFLTFFYEIAAALWEFIIASGLGVLYQSERFLDVKSMEYIIAVWIVRLLMLGLAFVIRKSSRMINGIAIAGLFGVVVVSEQNSIPINDDEMTRWIIFSILLLVAILFFHLNRQYEMEKTISDLNKEKNALLERDYQILRNTYAANAKLFHDFHNHIDALRQYLSKGSTSEAADYIENLCSPMQRTAQVVWGGDEAVDYLINSKIAIAVSKGIQVKTNIEFPRHTNIRSVDLVVILGNLLDNSLEATEGMEDSLRFINLTIRRINDMLVIKVENGCSVAPVVSDGDMQTSKTDKNLHGWGLKSIRTAAEHYDGTIETEYIKHTFRAVVTLSFEPIKI